MFTNPEKTFISHQPMADIFESIFEMMNELKCLNHNLSLETWVAADYPALIGRTVEMLEKFRERFIQHLFKPYNNGLVLTVPTVCLTELGYAMQANKTFNNGEAPVHKILTALGNMANVNLGNTSRTFQQIRSRKTGQTKYLDSLKASLTDRLNDFE